MPLEFSKLRIVDISERKLEISSCNLFIVSLFSISLANLCLYCKSLLTAALFTLINAFDSVSRIKSVLSVRTNITLTSRCCNCSKVTNHRSYSSIFSSHYKLNCKMFKCTTNRICHAIFNIRDSVSVKRWSEF